MPDSHCLYTEKHCKKWVEPFKIDFSPPAKWAVPAYRMLFSTGFDLILKPTQEYLYHHYETVYSQRHTEKSNL